VKHLLAAILLIVCISGYTRPQMQRVSISPGFLKGKDYLDMTATEKRVYAMGAVNGMLVAPLLDAPKEKVAWLERCTNNMTDEQVAAIITKYLNDNPGEWHYGMNVLSLNAMIANCPQSKGP
jgi:hypothetical protein